MGFLEMDERTKIEKKAAKFMFWGLVVPIVFLVFIRIFFLLFNYIYGTILIFIVGEKYAALVMLLSALTALFFTIGVLLWVNKQYKKHILATL